jgi:1,4-alpha-glucan branching enzyme
VRGGYRLGVPKAGYYKEILNTDAEVYGGSNVGNSGGAQSEQIPWQGREYSMQIELPPLAVVGFAL